MHNTLNSSDFGLKIYDKFPPKYREDDIAQKFALKRYLEALSDGGFKHAIDDINGITHLIDSEKIDANVLPFLFKQYGLEVFNGIPENYLRYLLPKLSEAWSKKGSLGVVEFIVSSLSGIKVDTEVSYDEAENPLVSVILEMDYNIGDYFPEAGQFNRILRNFIPFYCDSVLVYSYNFAEKQSIWCSEDKGQTLKITDTGIEKGILKLRKEQPSRSTMGKVLLGRMILGGFESYEVYKDSVKYATEDSGTLSSVHLQSSFTNTTFNTLNGNFFTNSYNGFDLITTKGITNIIFN